MGSVVLFDETVAVQLPRKSVYLNNLRIGEAATWIEVTKVLSRFVVALCGSRVRQTDMDDAGLTLAAVREFEACFQVKLFDYRSQAFETPTAFQVWL
jgi:hypothetical protein